MSYYLKRIHFNKAIIPGQPTDQLTASSEVQPKPTTTPSLSLEQGLEREVGIPSHLVFSLDFILQLLNYSS